MGLVNGLLGSVGTIVGGSLDMAGGILGTKSGAGASASASASTPEPAASAPSPRRDSDSFEMPSSLAQKGGGGGKIGVAGGDD
jgi:hypothetical protein